MSIKALFNAAEPVVKWEWWTSCSWRRLKTRGGEAVLMPTIASSDGHPDIVVKPENMAVIEAAPEMLRILQALVLNVTPTQLQRMQASEVLRKINRRVEELS